MTTNETIPMDTEITTREPMTALEKLKEELQSKRNLDVGFDHTDFNIVTATNLVLELDKYTQMSVFASWRGYTNMQCISQALKILPYDGFEKTAESRDEYDHLIAKTMEDYEAEGDYAPALPSFVAFNEFLRTTMYDHLIDVRPLEDTLDFMTKREQDLGTFEVEYDNRVKQGMRPGISKREFCEMKMTESQQRTNNTAESGQAAIQFIEDLNIHQDRGFGDLPDWAITRLYEKLVDSLVKRRAKLDDRRTNTSLPESARMEAEADETLLEFVYNEITGKEMVQEYGR
jgi:hypothetical protein